MTSKEITEVNRILNHLDRIITLSSRISGSINRYNDGILSYNILPTDVLAIMRDHIITGYAESIIHLLHGILLIDPKFRWDIKNNMQVIKNISDVISDSDIAEVFNNLINQVTDGKN